LWKALGELVVFFVALIDKGIAVDCAARVVVIFRALEGKPSDEEGKE
jgi:hypothetical protein